MHMLQAAGEHHYLTKKGSDGGDRPKRIYDDPYGIQALLKELGWSQHDLAKALDTNQAAVGRLVSSSPLGKAVYSPLVDRALAVLEAAKANPPRPNELRPVAPPRRAPPSRDADRRVRVHALNEKHGKSELSVGFGWAPAPNDTEDVPGMFGVVLRRDDMKPMFRPGDTLVVNPMLVPQPGSGVIIMTEDDSDVIVREFVGDTDTTWEVARYGPVPGREAIDKASHPRCLVVALVVPGR